MQEEKKEVSLLLAVGIVFLPFIFGWFLLKKGYSAKARWIGLSWTAFILIGALVDKPDNSNEASNLANATAPAANRPASNSNLPRIAESALIPYTKENGFEKTMAKFGPRLKEIEMYRKSAAEKVLASGKCDSVLTSDLSTSKSTLKNLNFWVDCQNGNRVYLSENDLKKSGPVLTQAEKAWDKGEAMVACERAIKANATRPNTVDIHHFSGNSFYIAKTTQNAVLRLDFDAKNAFGEEDAFTAICTFPPGEEGTIEVHKRQ